MEGLLGTTLPVFIGFTLLIMGFAAFMTGVGQANTWRPLWQIVPYCLLLGFVDRFLVWGLFDGELLLLSGYVIDTVALIGICLFAFRLTQARKMVAQYPWLFERRGILSWRERIKS